MSEEPINDLKLPKVIGNLGANPSNPDGLERAIFSARDDLIHKPSQFITGTELLPNLIDDDDLRAQAQEAILPLTSHVLNIFDQPISITPELIDAIKVPIGAAMTFPQVIQIALDFHIAKTRADRLLASPNEPSALDFMRIQDEVMAAEAFDRFKTPILIALEVYVRYQFAVARYLHGRFIPEDFAKYQKAFVQSLNEALEPWAVQSNGDHNVNVQGREIPIIVEPQSEEESSVSPELQKYTIEEIEDLVKNREYSDLRIHIYQLLKLSSEENPLTFKDFVTSILADGLIILDIPDYERDRLVNYFRDAFKGNLMEKLTFKSTTMQNRKLRSGYWLAVPADEFDKEISDYKDLVKRKPVQQTRVNPQIKSKLLVSTEMTKAPTKWQKVLDTFKSLTRPASRRYVAQIISPEITSSEDLRKLLNQVSTLSANIIKNGFNLIPVGSGKSTRYYIGEEAKLLRDQSAVLTNLEVDILNSRLENHLRGVIAWLSQTDINSNDYGQIPINSQKSAKNDAKYIEALAVTNLRSSILGPIYDLAINIRNIAVEQGIIEQISSPSNGYSQNKFEDDISRRATQMTKIMRENNIKLVINEDLYSADEIPTDDIVWRHIIRTYDIAVRLALKRDEFLELANNSIIQRGGGDTVSQVRIRKYR